MSSGKNPPRNFWEGQGGGAPRFEADIRFASNSMTPLECEEGLSAHYASPDEEGPWEESAWQKRMDGYSNLAFLLFSHLVIAALIWLIAYNLGIREGERKGAKIGADIRRGREFGIPVAPPPYSIRSLADTN